MLVDLLERGCWKSNVDDFVIVRKEKLSMCSWTTRFRLVDTNHK